MTKVGFILGSTVDPADLREAATVIEAAGFDTIWMSEDYFYTGGVSGASIALGATDHISVGIGLLPVYVRHPALTAMEAATIEGAFPGRFKLGFGSGVPAWLDQMGLAHEARLGTMRETVAAVRSLMAGETLTHSGHFSFDDVKLTFPPETTTPIYVGATGPKMTAVAGEVADGLLMSIMSTPEFVADSRRIVDAARPQGATRAELTTFAIFSLADDVVAARAAARPMVATYLALGPGPISDHAGISDELAAMLARGGRDLLFEEMPDAWVDRVAVCGDAATCRASIEALIEAGADEVALAAVPGSDSISVIRSAGSALGLVSA